MKRRSGGGGLAVRASLLVLIALYCFMGAVMNGSFAAGGGSATERLSRSAEIFFWLSVGAAVGALICAAGAMVAYRSKAER